MQHNFNKDLLDYSANNSYIINNHIYLNFFDTTCLMNTFYLIIIKKIHLSRYNNILNKIRDNVFSVFFRINRG